MMGQPLQNATLVFKVSSASAWLLANKRGFFSGSADDVRDGYIHLSTAKQLAGTLAKHFHGQSNLVLIALDTAALGATLKWEPSRGGELFPHLYQPLKTKNILWVKKLALGSDGVPVVPEDIA